MELARHRGEGGITACLPRLLGMRPRQMGGVPEIVRREQDGLLVEPRSTAHLRAEESIAATACGTIVWLWTCAAHAANAPLVSSRRDRWYTATARP